MDLTEHSFIQIFFIVLWIMMPAYLANTIAVLTGGKYPIDQGLRFISNTECCKGFYSLAKDPFLKHPSVSLINN